MVLRQLPPEGGTQEQGKCIIESVDLARQAVQLDVTDGTSWCKFASISSTNLLRMITKTIQICSFIHSISESELLIYDI